jgi:hypothetical protein
MPGERRSVPRVELPAPVSAKVKAALPARILDISSQGAQIEVTSLLRPGVTCDLKILAKDGELSLRAMVRRCRAWGFGLDEKEQKVLLYRAGFEFEDPSPEDMARITSSFLFSAKPKDAVVEPELLADRTLVGPGGVPHRAPMRQGPVKIRISDEHARRIMDTGKRKSK